jgi:predicted branched-subunit amino acid permease
VAPSARAALLDGARLIGGTVFGTFCWGAAIGMALVKGGLSSMQALGMVMLVFSGTAQVAALPLIAQGAALPAIWLTAHCWPIFVSWSTAQWWPTSFAADRWRSGC